MLPVNIVNALIRIARELNFIDYQLVTKAGSNHGDNFIGVMIAVSIAGTRSIDGKQFQDTIYLICKTPPLNETRRKNFNANMVFDRELYLYSTVLPTFMKFQQEKGLGAEDSFTAIPKIYACETDTANDSYVLIMEDLRTKNFEMWPKEKTPAIDHALLLVKQLGRLHGISFAMKDQRPEEFAEFKKLTDTFCPIVRGKLRCFFDKTLKRVGDTVTDPKHKEYVQRFDLMRSLDKVFAVDACDKFGVITHGDCWNNNFMFQYSEDDAHDMINMNMIDWQMSRYCSPALDLLYNIFGGTDPEFRRQHYEELLETYYAGLSGMVRKLGSNPYKLFTFQNLKDELRKFGEFAVYCAPMIIQIRIAAAKDVRDLDEYCNAIDNGEDADLLNEFDDETQAKFSDLINGYMSDLFEYGYVGSN